MLCGEAAEHQLALISDTAEISDTYLNPPDEVQPGNPHTMQSMHLQILRLKMEESTAQKQV